MAGAASRGRARLRHVYLRDTAVTPGGVDALKKALPDVPVTR
jgi:hypothetical protein